MRRVGPITLELVQPNPLSAEGIYIQVTRKGNGRTWKGYASFPLGMYNLAQDKIAEVEDDEDLDNLLREWSDAETWQGWQRFWAEETE
jgi:hypothetical protein